MNINETPRPSDSEPKQTPQELNAKLYDFFEHLSLPLTDMVPEDSANLVIDLLKSFRRRYRNEYAHQIEMAFMEVLKCAPTTGVFREYAASLFHHGMTFGMNLSYPYKSPIYWLLDISKSEGGIFDKKRAEELERQAYNNHLQHELIYRNKGLEEAVNWSESHPIPPVFSEYSMRLGLWRKQFIENYGEKP